MNSSTEKAEGFEACEFREFLAQLRRIYFFSRLPLDVLKVFAYLCTKERFRAGDALIRQGEDDGQAFCILEGEARLIREEAEGERNIRSLGPETFLGGMSLLTESPRLFTLRAETDMACLVLNRKRFLRTLEQFPDVSSKLMGAIVEQIHSWESQNLIGGEGASKAGVSLI
ncbi:MAG: cyclic nucleotide-binding domain-containing protein [Desulfococcaceae bacterium]